MSEAETSTASDSIIEKVEAERYEEALGLSFSANRAEATAAFIRLSGRHSNQDRVRIALNKARSAMQSETDLQKGVRLCGIEEQEAAVLCFRRAVTQNEGLLAYRQLGQTLSRLGREEEALPFLEQAKQLGDESEDYHWLGSSLAVLGRRKDALPHLREAVRRRGWALDHDWLATTLLELGRKAESLPYLRKVAELRADIEDLHLLGRTLAELGEREAAVPHFEKAATQRGSVVDLHWLGRTLAELGRNTEAVPHLERAVALCGDGEDHHWLGRALAETDRKEAAIDHLGLAVEERGEPSDYHWLGVTLVDLGREEEAVPYLKLAVEGGGDPWDYRCLGRTLFNLGRHEEALACFEEVVERYGDAADHHWLRRVLSELGRQDEAPSPVGLSGGEGGAGISCATCGKRYDPSDSDRFCNYCGCPLPSRTGSIEVGTPVQTALVPASIQAAPEAHEEAPTSAPVAPPESALLDIAVESSDDKSISTAVPPTQPGEAPYAIFVSLVLGSALFVSTLVFNIAQAFARNQWENTISTVVATTAAVLLARSAWGAWRRIVSAEPEEDDMLKRRHRRVLGTSGVVLVLFFTTSAIVGAAIGNSRVEAVQLSVDLERMTTVGNRISKARSSVEATIASYIEVYKAIEPDVQELESTLRRLITELGVYDGKFPTQHDQTAKSIAGMETGIERVALIKQQIDAAKHIDALDPGQQLAAWKMKMVPLLDSEEALDKSK